MMEDARKRKNGGQEKGENGGQEKGENRGQENGGQEKEKMEVKKKKKWDQEKQKCKNNCSCYHLVLYSEFSQNQKVLKLKNKC